MMTNKEVMEYASELRQKCIEETRNHPNLSAHIIVAKVRDYNRIWNKKAEENPEMKKDGFNNLMKSFYKDFDIKSVKEAIKYL